MVNIGTPLQSQAKRVLLLGSGELGKELTIALQQLGVEVHAADRYANAPAMQVAHFAHVLSMTDETALKNLITKIQPDLIVPEIEAIATQVLVDIEKEKFATVIPTATATQLTMNRQGIRKLAAEKLGLATSQYRFANSLDELKAAADDIGYPCFIKPVMSSSGKGQSYVKKYAELDAAWDYAQSGGRVNNQPIIIEGKIDFDVEITLLTIRAIDSATGNVKTYFCDPIGHKQEHGDYVESWQPQHLSDKALELAQNIADQITTALGGLGLFGVELFVKGDMVWFSEVSPRPHDTGLVTLASQYQNEFELHARAILGLPVDPSRHSIAASAVLYAGVDGSNLTYQHIDKALSIPTTDIRLFGKPEGFTKRRMGVITARGDSVDQARQRATNAASQVNVII